MKEIPLSQGKVAIVDDEDFERLSAVKWWLSHGYAMRTDTANGVRTHVWMHRVIANTPDGLGTDHINGNRLDNRRANLRHATQHQNSFNRPGGNKEHYKGVSPRYGKWRAVASLNDQYYRVGTYATEAEAASAYDLKAVELHGEFARLNFPERRAEYVEKLAAMGGTFVVELDPKVYGATNRAKTHCKIGHGYTPENTYTDLQGYRHCKACSKISAAKRLMKPLLLRGRLVRGRGLANALKTHCPHGHEYTPENTHIRPGGGRRCKTCRMSANRRHVAASGKLWRMR